MFIWFSSGYPDVNDYAPLALGFHFHFGLCFFTFPRDTDDVNDYAPLALLFLCFFLLGLHPRLVMARPWRLVSFFILALILVCVYFVFIGQH